MQIFLQEFSPTLLQQAELHFSPDFLASLHPPHLDQKKIKNLILQQQLNLSEEQLSLANQSYRWDAKFFSASYTEDYFLLAIAEQKIGVDLEQIRARSDILLANYQQELEKVFGKVDWSGFYLLWTAREAILKASDTADLDQMEQILFLSLHSEHSEKEDT